MKPVVRALALITRGGPKAGCFSPAPLQALVQCDGAESFYRFPGGQVEVGETAAEAIVRELQEEYDLQATPGVLAVVEECFFLEDEHQSHEVNLLHWCDVADAADLPDTLPHNERPGIKLVWRNLAQLQARPLHPAGILEVLEEGGGPVRHLITKT